MVSSTRSARASDAIECHWDEADPLSIDLVSYGNKAMLFVKTHRIWGRAQADQAGVCAAQKMMKQVAADACPLGVIGDKEMGEVVAVTQRGEPMQLTSRDGFDGNKVVFLKHGTQIWDDDLFEFSLTLLAELGKNVRRRGS